MDISLLLDKKRHKLNWRKLGGHPRFFFTREKTEELKKWISEDPLYRRFYEDILKYAHKEQMKRIPIQIDKYSGFVWRYTAYLPIMGAAELLSGSGEYYQYILEWMKEYLKYPLTDEMSLDLPELHGNLPAISASLITDWFYDSLPEELLKAVKELLFARAQAIYEFANKPHCDGWNKSVMQNHRHIAIAAMGIIGLVFYEDEPERCGKYVELAVASFSAMFEITGEDGCFHEGFGYWFYGFLTPFVFFDMLNEATGVDFLKEPWLQNNIDYLLFNYFPENHFDPLAEYFSFGDDYGYQRTKEPMIRLIAKATGSCELQYLAQLSYEKGLSTYHGNFLNLFWNQKGLLAKAPGETDYHVSALFDNYGYLFSRSGWNGDESCFASRCGTPLGKKWQELIKTVPFFEMGAAHVHPDAGHFILFGKGQILLRDDEYSYDKKTVTHNTLLINGVGQMGENVQWFSKSECYLDANMDMKLIVDDPRVTVAEADLKDAYGDNGRLSCLKRYFLFFKEDDCLIVYDKIRAEQENKISAYFWPWNTTIFEYGSNRVFVPGEKANLKIISLKTTEMDIKEMEIYSRYYKESRSAVSFIAYADNADLIYAMPYSSGDKEPWEVNATVDGDIISVYFEGRDYHINLSSGDISEKESAIVNKECSPIALFSNGREIDGFSKDTFSYELTKLPWQEENHLFFTGNGNRAFPEYKVRIVDELVKGLGEIPIKNVCDSSHYFSGDVKNAVSPDERMWTCDQPEGFMLIELFEEALVSAVRIMFGRRERFSYDVKIETSVDGVSFKGQELTACESKEGITEFTFKEPDTVKYVKLINMGNGYNTFINVVEIGII